MKLIRKCEQWLKLWATAEASDEKVSTAQNQVKNALIQTYFTSLLCLVLCVTMFLGTTYAWFASEVNNEGNEIYVGVLKVGLLKETADKDGDGKPDLADLAVEGNKLFDNTIRWEPGFTALETVQIVNLGDLAFKYVLNFTDGTLNEEEDPQNPGGAATQAADENATGTQDPADEVALAEVAKYFDVWVYDHQKEGNTYVVPGSYNDINEANGWTPVGTLAEVLDGKTVLSGTMNKVRKGGQAVNAVNEGTTDGVSTEHEFTIALHMQKTAGAEVMGQKISLNVKLVGYQMTAETDALGNASYDDNLVIVSNAKALKDALADNQNKDVVLTSDIELTKPEECIQTGAGILDGNGNTITYSGVMRNSPPAAVTTSGGKIANLTIDGGDYGYALSVQTLSSDLVVSNCVLSGATSFDVNGGQPNENAVISFIDTTFDDKVSYSNVAKQVYFTDCTFKDVLKPNGDTVLTNCEFTGETLDLSALVGNETVTLINCTYNGQPIENVIVTSRTPNYEVKGDSTVKVENAKLRLSSNG